MDEIVRKAVERAIGTMAEKLGEQLTIDDIARSAMFSKFHFSRVFQHATGVSPGRFLSAMRLEEAKRLLLSTSTSVVDISHRVGYNSVGTFSTRFSCRVGVSPTAYRQFGGLAPRITPSVHRGPGPVTTIVRGHVHAPLSEEPGPVFVGLFPGRIPEGKPVRYTVLDRPGAYALQDVPEGNWYLLAHCASPNGWSRPRRVGCEGPLTIRASVVARLVDLQLRPVRSFDPPVLLALPAVRALEPAALAS
jgi:AraC-like DNA-binding protein